MYIIMKWDRREIKQMNGRIASATPTRGIKQKRNVGTLAPVMTYIQVNLHATCCLERTESAQALASGVMAKLRRS